VRSKSIYGGIWQQERERNEKQRKRWMGNEEKFLKEKEDVLTKL